MIILSLMFILILMILTCLMLFSIIISKKKIFDREKFSPFECGFDPKSFTRTPFSIHFFIITIIFLIFDVEISIILPMILSFKINNKMYWYISSTLFMVILIIGIFYEWSLNLMNWKF
uniref:NADH dehydrogenase subunit 3 n=1 Tax=Potamyia chinensis TaxID=1875907 RepID=UPI002238F6B4|nr:NADH dehydrogenase subunit 3 [Potamyia chinensis]UYO79418.1 NADH dehydrogenase subunit 3 [Potamyia chinensis]